MDAKEFWDAVNFVCTVEFWRMAVFWTLSLILSYFQLLTQRFFSQKPKKYVCSFQPLLPATTSVPSGSDAVGRPVCVITGATSGLGAAAAYDLSMKGFYIVLAGRSSESLSKVISDIKRHNTSACVKAFQVDISSFKSILKFKSSLHQWLLDSDMHSSIQLLINNAGILATSSRITAEEYDQFMSTQNCASFSSLMSLIDKLVSGRNLVSVADPGAVKTNIMREIPFHISRIAFLSLKLLGILESSDSGVRSILDAALAPPEITGVYFFGGNGRTIKSSALSYSTKLSKDLWDASNEMFAELQLASTNVST